MHPTEFLFCSCGLNSRINIGAQDNFQALLNSAAAIYQLSPLMRGLESNDRALELYIKGVGCLVNRLFALSRDWFDCATIAQWCSDNSSMQFLATEHQNQVWRAATKYYQSDKFHKKTEEAQEFERRRVYDEKRQKKDEDDQEQAKKRKKGYPQNLFHTPLFLHDKRYSFG